MFNYLKTAMKTTIFHLIVNNAFSWWTRNMFLVTDFWLQTGTCLKGTKTRPCFIVKQFGVHLKCLVKGLWWLFVDQVSKCPLGFWSILFYFSTIAHPILQDYWMRITVFVFLCYICKKVSMGDHFFPNFFILAFS